MKYSVTSWIFNKIIFYEIKHINATNILGDSAFYHWAVNGVYTPEIRKERIINLYTNELKIAYIQNMDYYVFNASIVELLDNNLNGKFIGVGYIKYTETATGETHYKFATLVYNVRSMLDVANRVMEDNSANTLNPIEKAVIDRLYIKKYYEAKTQSDGLGFNMFMIV